MTATTTQRIAPPSDTVPSVQIPGFRGEVITAEHAGYDAARAVWNRTVDRRPRLIARCSGPADVRAAVRFARDRDLEIALGRPVRCANDANCFATSEAVDGAARDARVVFGVILGTGVGGGVVVDRQPLLGANAVAGEWGHIGLPWPRDDERPGPACYCGKRGCIETFLSGPGLARDHEARTGTRLAAEAVVEGVARGDAAAASTLARYESRLARALAAVINVLDPDVVVLGGGLSNVERLYDVVPRLWCEWVFSDVAHTRLARNRHGDSSGVRGAAWLWDP